MLESGRATLYELKSVYSTEDMYDIWEVFYTGQYNKLKAREQAEQHAKLVKSARR